MRLVHEGFCTLLCEDDRLQRWLFDPQEPDEADVYVFSGLPDPYAAQGLLEVIRRGDDPVVVAPRAAHDWLRSHGKVQLSTPDEHEALTALPYQAPPSGAARRRGLRNRVKARLGRLPEIAVDLPSLHPVAWRLEVPDGHVVVHLGLALHDNTPAAWLDEARSVLLEGHTNLVAGYGLHQERAFIGHIRSLEPKRLLLMDLNNDRRRLEGREVPLITPTRDALLDAGLETHVFVSGVSQRFEPDNTVKRW